MKILKICGVVLAAHAVFFLAILVTPGCSVTSNAAAAPSAPPAEAPAGPPPSVSVPAAHDGPLITPAPLRGPDQGQTAGSLDANEPARYSPTRPGTAAASAVEAQPVADVTPATTYAVVTGDSLWTVSRKFHLTMAELASANNLPSNARLKLGQKLLIPSTSTTTSSAAAAGGGPGPTTVARAEGTYTVKSGDRLATIARRAGTTVAALKAANGMKNDIIRPGMVLHLPSGSEVAAAAAGDALPAGKSKSTGAMTYDVKPGEKLREIARKLDVSYSDLIKANNITDPAKVQPGTSLVVPGWKAPRKAAAPAPQPAAPTPAADQDLDTGLKPAGSGDIPVIKIDDSGGTPPANP